MGAPTLSPLLNYLYRQCSPEHRSCCSDADLLKRFAYQADQDAFRLLVHRHGPMVLGLCRRLLANDQDAEDAFQATFLILAQKCGGLRQPQQLPCWLHGVAFRVASRIRTQVASRRATALKDDNGLLDDRDPAIEAATRELQQIVDEEIHRLPAKYRQPMVLCYLQGKSYTEAAVSLGCPAGTISVRLARAREKLRLRLEHRGLVLSAGVLASLLAEPSWAATLPASLAAATVRAAGCLAVAQATTLGLVSTQVKTLTEGVLQTMWLIKMKTVIAVSLAVALLGTGLGGVLWHQGSQATAQEPVRVQTGQQRQAGQQKDQLEGQHRALYKLLADHLDQHQQHKEKHADHDSKKHADELAAFMYAAQFAQSLQSPRNAALDKIAQGIEDLRKAVGKDAKSTEAIDKFAKAFDELKGKIMGGDSSPGDVYRKLVEGYLELEKQKQKSLMEDYQKAHWEFLEDLLKKVHKERDEQAQRDREAIQKYWQGILEAQKQVEKKQQHEAQKQLQKKEQHDEGHNPVDSGAAAKAQQELLSSQKEQERKIAHEILKKLTGSSDAHMKELHTMIQKLLQEKQSDNARQQKADAEAAAISELRFKGDVKLADIALEGEVLRVDRTKKHVLIGSVDNKEIPDGTLYRVYRGKDNTVQTGVIRVIRTAGPWAIAEIQQEFAPPATIQQGDRLRCTDDGSSR